MMQSIRFAERALSHMPDWACEKVDVFDPARRAQVIRALFSTDEPVAGRASFGGRPLQWRELEDKIVVDALWDEAGVSRAPRELVSMDLPALQRAHKALDQGKGTVWAADNKEGWHGGASGVRWVQTPQEQQSAFAFFSGRCEQIRVMPFLDGIPCSIHGWVFPNATISFRPCEMLVFRVSGTRTFKYAGSATSWHPPDPVTRNMKQVAECVGEHLRLKVGYRGSFTVDGVLTKNGFYPTELNPRFGAALGRMAGSLNELPLYLLHLVTVQGLDLEYRPSELERIINQAVEDEPVVRAMYQKHGAKQVTPRTLFFRKEEGQWSEVAEEESAHAVVTIGEGPTGPLLFVTLEKEAIRKGESHASDLCAVFAAVDRNLNLGLESLEAALDVYPSN